MTPPTSITLLKQVLENLSTPERLDDHPWTRSLLVHDLYSRNPSLRSQPPGLGVAVMVTDVFRELLPPEAPRKGKRLDTRWGQMGLLGARYFAPFLYGLPYPGSLRDAWPRIDDAIARFVFDGNGPADPADQARYRLVGDEPEAAADSTLSDWQRGGIQRLAEAIEGAEKHLQHLPALQRGRAAADAGRTSRRGAWKVVLLALAALLAAMLVFGGLKARRLYDQALLVRQDAAELKSGAASTPGLEGVRQAGPALKKLRGDLDLLKTEAAPWLPLGAWLRWVPVYGGDLASAGQILELADLSLQAGEGTYAALQPLLRALEQPVSLTPVQAVRLLGDASPGLEEALKTVEKAAELRSQLPVEQLSPRTRGLVTSYLDPLLPLMQDGLQAASALPGFMGATSSGPKTYLLLVQNEDELRATGGFITAVGNLVVKDGQILSLSFQDSGTLEDWSMPYPPAPWQLEEYMNSTVLVLRDSNWFTEFPLAAQYAEYLYSYISRHSVDGVIAIDQHSLVVLLETLGPVRVAGRDEYVYAGNVQDYMRRAKSPPAGEPLPQGWTNKSFMEDIAAPVIRRVYHSGPGEWQELAASLLRLLDERHILLQVDDQRLAQVIARHAWDGSVAPGGGDFLMVVDSNVGFNKTNAAIETSLVYDVDLTDLAAPQGTVTVIHQNTSPAMPACAQWDKARAPGQEKYPIDDCYWDYMRVYAPQESALLDHEAQQVPASWVMLGETVPARIDPLEEDIPGTEGFGTLVVVPGGGSIETMLRYALPAAVLQDTADGRTQYSLTVQKQPGTVAVPITVRIHLPAGARLETLPPGAVLQENNLLLQSNLRRDLHLELLFTSVSS